MWYDLFVGQVELTINAGSGSPLVFHLPAWLGTNACASTKYHFIPENRCRDLIEINAPRMRSHAGGDRKPHQPVGSSNPLFPGVDPGRADGS